MECVRFCDSVYGKGANIVFVGYDGLVHKADTDSAGNQRFDRHKAADGNFSAEVAAFISRRNQTLLKNTTGTRSLFPDNKSSIATCFPHNGLFLAQIPTNGSIRSK